MWVVVWQFELTGPQAPADERQGACKARTYSAGFRGYIWRGQVPDDEGFAAASTTSTVMASSCKWMLLCIVKLLVVDLRVVMVCSCSSDQDRLGGRCRSAGRLHF